ncbi:hypothetical protein N7G274_000854 [Stereocaulon virgatum]|uniref:Uncharacterized protein n=1 Tax=Stereocaulon virgatum TaxID=373712 RepID=A0ABR4APU1_9LECA
MQPYIQSTDEVLENEQVSHYEDDVEEELVIDDLDIGRILKRRRMLASLIHLSIESRNLRSVIWNSWNRYV